MIKLNSKCKSTFVEKIEKGLPDVTFGSRGAQTYEAVIVAYAAEQVLPGGAGHARDTLERMIGDWPVFELMTDLIARHVVDRYGEKKIEQGTKVVDIPDFDDPSRFANRIADLIESLPKEYFVTFELPMAIWEIIEDGATFKLGESICLTRNLELLNSNFPMHFANDNKKIYVQQKSRYGHARSLLVPEGIPLAWTDGACYLQVMVSGYVSMDTITTPILEAIGLLRAFLGLGLATELFSFGAPTTWPINPGRQYFIHVSEDGENSIDGRNYLDDLITSALDRLSITGVASKPLPLSRLSLNQHLERMQPVLNNIQESEKIILACQWYFDSFRSGDDLLGFMQTMIAVEAILGDGDFREVGVGALIRNRAAYMIATDRQEREEIIKNITEIYQMRSAIVHNGKSRFSLSEKVKYNRLRSICQRVIAAEASMLKRKN